MGYKVGGLLLLLVLLCLIVLNGDDKKDKKISYESSNLHTDVVVFNRAHSQAQSQKKPIEHHSKKQPERVLTPEETDRLALVMKEISAPEYSDDAYVEVAMQSSQLMYCEMFTRGFLRAELKGKIKNKVWDDRYKANCEAKRKQHPHLTISIFTGNDLDWVPTNSPWGESLKALNAKAFNQRESESKQLIRLSLRSKSAHKVLLSTQYGNTEKAFKFGDWLGTNNKRYIKLITGLSMNHLICESDSEGLCGPNSGILAESCWQTPSDCGMPFYEWFEKNHMPGVKKDVALVVAKLKAYSNGEDIE